MAYRHRVVFIVKYGRFNDALSALQRLNEISAERGWTTSRILVPFVGATNEIILETDHPDLATFERQSAAFYADGEAMKAWRAAADVVVEGSGHDALYSDASTLA